MPRLIDAAYEHNWCSAVGALTGVLRALGTDLPAARVSALSGHAFRLAIIASEGGEIGAEGVNHFPAEEAAALYENLGWQFHALACPVTGDQADCRKSALDMVGDCLNQGRPAVLFGLHLPEFGIARGYDAGVLYASTIMSGQYGERISVEQWPAPGHTLPIRGFLPKRRVASEPTMALERLLHFVTHYARSTVQPSSQGGPAVGLDAFDRWIDVLNSDATISGRGQAYVIQALQSGRAEAATFLRAEADRLPEAAAPLREAAMAYTAEVLELSRMATLFPFPTGGDATSRGLRAAGAGHVGRAREAEARAVQHVEHACGAVERLAARSGDRRFRLPFTRRRQTD